MTATSKQKAVISIFLSGLLAVFVGSAYATPPNLFKKILPKNVEADPNKEYVLDESKGPWMILVSSFDGPQARQNANALVFELRKSFKYEAYLFEQTFTHDLNAEKRPRRNPYEPRQNYRTKGKFQQYAVLVGNFQSIDDEDYKRTLREIKSCHPECIYKMRGIVNQAQNIPKGTPGPFHMSSFGVTNPALPEEYFNSGGIDKFIEKINQQRPYSLLHCPGKFTVLVATFTGKVEIKPERVNAILEGREKFQEKKVSDLELGEKAAVRLCKVLRDAGYEAYEFHDRNASIVTVGSFETCGQKLPDGTINLHPEIVNIINRFQGKPAQRGVNKDTISFEPVRFDNIECDVQPKLVEVPRRRH